MRYLVMETHPAYAVLLDQEGRFLRAANLGYQVGDRVDQVVALREGPPRAFPWARAAAGLCAAAACCCLVFFGYYQPNYCPYGALRIQINPDVEMTVSRTGRVLALEGRNEEGARLVEDYTYQGKGQEEAAVELVERAVQMGYLEQGDTIAITVESGDGAWRTREETETLQALQEAYGDWADIRLSRDGDPPQPAQTPSAPIEITVPVGTAPPLSTPAAPPASTPAPSVPTAAPTPVPDYGEDDEDDEDDDDSDDDGDD